MGDILEWEYIDINLLCMSAILTTDKDTFRNISKSQRRKAGLCGVFGLLVRAP
jgi:hypothetical protein